MTAVAFAFEVGSIERQERRPREDETCFGDHDFPKWGRWRLKTPGVREFGLVFCDECYGKLPAGIKGTIFETYTPPGQNEERPPCECGHSWPDHSTNPVLGCMEEVEPDIFCECRKTDRASG